MSDLVVPSEEFDPSEDQNAKLLAALAYAGPFLSGLPLFLIPMIMKNDPFSLQHSKHGAEIFAMNLILGVLLIPVFIVVFIIGYLTCGIGFILVPVIVLVVLALVFTPTIHGIILAFQGQNRAPILTFGLGEKYLAGVQMDPKP